jgi:hypothetical protein
VFLISWQEQLRRIKADLEARHRSPLPPPRVPNSWEARLAYLRGELHADGYERVPTHGAFDRLGLRRSERTSDAARRLARAMRQLGWESARFQPTPGSYQRVRGFIRRPCPAPKKCVLAKQ